MTTNQIAYQKARAEIEERAEKAKELRLANEMQDLANRQEKFWHYGISDPNDPTITKAWPVEAFKRGVAGARDLFGLFGEAAKVAGSGSSTTNNKHVNNYNKKETTVNRYYR